MERKFKKVGLHKALALGINVMTNQSILNVWPGAVWPALVTATAVTSLLTFIFFKWWVFKG